MILTVLVENSSLSGNIFYEHGLSFYIETEKHRILFDMGQSDSFIKNAKVLGIDLKKVDVAFLSHGHYDHGGGLEAFMNINSSAKIYINKNAFLDYYASDGRYLGLNKNLESEERITFTDDTLRIDDELYPFTGNNLERKHYMSFFGLFEKREKNLYPDNFLHEQYLVITEKGKNVLISGCSHKGILNIMDWVKDYNVSAVFGGFHFMKLECSENMSYLQNAAEILLSHNTKYYTCHCTGEVQYNELKKIMNKQIEYISAGKTITL